MCAGAQALRCLALAYKSVPEASGSSLSPLDEAGLTFIAMVAMHDPPRRECAAAIQLCRQVRVVSGRMLRTALNAAWCTRLHSTQGAKGWLPVCVTTQVNGVIRCVLCNATTARANALLHLMHLLMLLQAGIRVVVVTGDNQATAEAVCRSIGALGQDAGLDAQQLSSLTGPHRAMARKQPESLGFRTSVVDWEESGLLGCQLGAHKGKATLWGALSLPRPHVHAAAGAEFDALSPAEQTAASKSLAVFARVEPLHKLKLVELLRDQVCKGGRAAVCGPCASDSPQVMCAHCKRQDGLGLG